MKIEVKTFATLQALVPSLSEYETESGSTVGTVMKLLGIPEEKVTIIFVNNVHGSLETVLQEGDSIGLFPPIGGG